MITTNSTSGWAISSMQCHHLIHQEQWAEDTQAALVRASLHLHHCLMYTSGRLATTGCPYRSTDPGTETLCARFHDRNMARNGRLTGQFQATNRHRRHFDRRSHAKPCCRDTPLMMMMFIAISARDSSSLVMTVYCHDGQSRGPQRSEPKIPSQRLKLPMS